VSKKIVCGPYYRSLGYQGGGTALVRTGCRKFSITVPDYGVFGMGSSSPSLVSAHVADANSTGIYTIHHPGADIAQGVKI